MKTTPLRNSIILIIFCLIMNLPLSAGGPAEPTEAERTAFLSKLERFMGHQGLHTHDVSEVLASLNNPIMKMVECPEGTSVMKVIINIKTKQIKWDRALVVNDKPAGVGSSDIGWYQWTYKQSIEEGVKTIEACNYIMIDSMIMVDQEASPPFGPIADEALLLHELLHGQLVIDSIMNSPAYQQKLCDCNFDLSAADFSHDVIADEEESYIEALLRELGEDDPTVHIVSADATPSDENGKFKIKVADESILEGKENPKIEYYFPKGDNMVRDSLKLLFEDEMIFVTGCLKDKSKNGLVVFIIDPPGVYLFGGIEQAFEVLPASPKIPVLQVWGLLILLLIMTIAAVVALSGSPEQRTFKRKTPF